MALWFALGAIAILVGFLFIAMGKEDGASPADVAIAYELAWDRLDFDTLFDLSGPELRDGAKRPGFVATKRSAYAGVQRGRLAAKIGVENVVAAADAALVVTNVFTGDGAVRNNVLMERRAGRWYVVGYSLRSG
jgi:hypothetical protein